MKLFDFITSSAKIGWSTGFQIFAMVIVFFGYIQFAAPSAAMDMVFSLVPIRGGPHCSETCPKVIDALGEITDTTPDDFLNFLRQMLPSSRIRPIIFLNSPGGKVVASMELGRAFRRLGMVAIVARILPGEREDLTHFTGGECFSACVYALMGGKRRVIPPQSVVGLHRMFMVGPSNDFFGLNGPSRRQFDDGEIARLLRRYSKTMGVNPTVIDHAEHMPPDYVHILSRAEIAKWGLGQPRL